ncbi:MAG TPA: ABC transporter substrate-binding protein [Candidatus Woesebacteria bacterium]|nr:ABC transporter substrate-binding protein [Candidatus Woesebacteria bacterium]
MQKASTMSIDSTRRKLVAGAASIPLISLSKNASSDNLPSKPFSVRAGLGLDAFYATYLVAEELGYWKNANINFSYSHFDDGSIAYDAIASGNADIASATFNSLLQRTDKGLKLWAVAPIARSGKLFSIVAKKDIKSPKDLENKKVAIQNGGITQMLFQRYAKENNINTQNIGFVHVAAPESVAALKRGDVDAFLLWEPWPSRALSLMNDVHKLGTMADYKIYVYNWLVVGESLINKRPEMERILAVLNQATSFINNNKDKVVDIVSKRFRLSKDDAIFQISNIDYVMDFSKDIVLQHYKVESEFALNAKKIKQIPPVDSVIRPEFLRSVDAKLTAGW